MEIVENRRSAHYRADFHQTRHVQRVDRPVAAECCVLSNIHATGYRTGVHHASARLDRNIARNGPLVIEFTENPDLTIDMDSVDQSGCRLDHPPAGEAHDVQIGKATGREREGAY